jgi:Ca2+-binding EF-hand superfamily protein
MVAKNFDAIDTDKDGTVSQIEIDTFTVMMNDKDSDGTLDKKEIKNKAIAKAFDQLDTDKDGTLDAKEISAFFGQK